MDAALADIRGEVKAERQRQKDMQRRQANAWKLTAVLEHTVLIIYGLTGYAAEPAVNFLAACGRRRHWPEKSEEELETIVVDLFLKVDAVELAGLTDTEGPADPAAMVAALPVVEQWRLVAWTAGANTTKGVAPSTDALLHRLEVERLKLPEAVRPEPRGTVADSRAREWARRWRRRWGGRHGKLKICEAISVPDMQAKARVTTVGDAWWAAGGRRSGHFAAPE